MGTGYGRMPAGRYRGPGEPSASPMAGAASMGTQNTSANRSFMARQERSSARLS